MRLAAEHFLRGCVVGLVAMAPADVARAIAIWGNDSIEGTFDPLRHDRFYAPGPGETKDLLGVERDPDLSGIARETSSGGGRWATMISDTWFISAEHYHPTAGNSVTFYRDDNTTTGWTGSVQSGSQRRIGQTDLWLGRIANNEGAAPPEWVRRYPLIKRIDSLNYLGFAPEVVDSSVVLVGTHHAPNPGPLYSGTPTVRVGLNRIDRVLNDRVDDIGGFLTYAYDENDFILDESGTKSGDSGGPSLGRVEGVGDVLVGIHRGTSIDTSISAHVDEIASALSAGPNAETVHVVTDLAGDLNMDFRVDLLDIDIIGGRLGQSVPRFSSGDINGDGRVDLLDLDVLGPQFGKAMEASGDFNGNFIMERAELLQIGNDWLQPSATSGDANRDGRVDAKDLQAFDAFFPADNPDWSREAPLVDLMADIDGDFDVDRFDHEVFFGDDRLPGWFGLRDVERADLNDDGQVDVLDLEIFLGAYNETLGTVYADINGDGVVDSLDALTIEANWETRVGSLGQSAGDLNGDGYVDQTDFDSYLNFWRYRPGDRFGPPPGVVPEPGTGLVLLLSLLGVRRSRRLGV